MASMDQRKSIMNASGRPIPSTHILPSSPQLTKYVSRLSRPSILILIYNWLQNSANNPVDTSPLDDEDEDEDTNEEDENAIDRIRTAYESIKTRKEIVDRIFEREWRHGLSMLQVAQLDIQYMLDHPISQKWTTGELVPQSKHQRDTSCQIPKFHPQSFIKSLQILISTMVQCHYHIVSHPTLPLNILRLALYPPHPMPTTLPLQSSVYYLALPHASLHIFFTAPKSPLVDVVRSSLPAALSSQHHRFDIISTALSAKSLETLCTMKGSERGATGINGGWTIYKPEGNDGVDNNPLESSALRRRRQEDDDESDQSSSISKDREEIKRRKIAEGRFGISGKVDDRAALERVQFYVRDRFPQAVDKDFPPLVDGVLEVDKQPWLSRDWRPSVSISLEGSHVFAGVRTLVEEGIVDGNKMPGWMTGEEGKSIGIVRDQKVVETNRRAVGFGEVTLRV